MTAPKDWQKALAAGIAGGLAVRALSVPLTGMREPFDAPGLYYPLAMLLCGICAALPPPRHWWLAVIGIFLGERLYAYLLLPETRDWLLFRILINVLLPTWLPAAAGAVPCIAGASAAAAKAEIRHQAAGHRQPCDAQARRLRRADAPGDQDCHMRAARWNRRHSGRRAFVANIGEHCSLTLFCCLLAA